MLRDGTKPHLCVSAEWRQPISKILAIIDNWCWISAARLATTSPLKAQHIITAETQVRSEFTAEQLQQSEYLLLPAFYYRTAFTYGLYTDADISDASNSIRLIYDSNWRITVRYVSACMICRGRHGRTQPACRITRCASAQIEVNMGQWCFH